MESDRSREPDPAELRRCFFIRALEETDAAGTSLTLAERIRATEAAEGLTGFEFVQARAGVLGTRLKGPLAAAFAGLSGTGGGVPGWAAVGLPASAFAAGWLLHDLGEAGRVSLLAFPLLGLIVWNLAVVVLALTGFGRVRAGSLPALPRWLRRVPAPTGDALTDKVLARTEQEWQAAEGATLLLQAKRMFHTTALFLAAGVVAGMYARGLVRNYQASWESTFLTQPAVSRLTRIVLGPASILTGVPVPAVPPQGGPSPAAPWIHLWAATAGLFVFLPRLLLISQTWREARQARTEGRGSFDEYAAAARRLAGGQPLVTRVLPLQCEPDSPLRDSLRGVLQHLWGGQVMVDFLPTVPYGGEDEALAALTETPTHLVLLWPMAVTPEAEVQGALHTGLEKLLSSAALPPFALTVLDAAAFEARLAGMPELPRRLAERRAAWEKILGPAWPLLVLDQAARKDPGAAAASVAAARLPLAPGPARA